MTVSRCGPCVGQRETCRARTNSRQARRILVQGEPVALPSPWARRLHPRTGHGRWHWYLRAKPVRSGATGRSRARSDGAASVPTFKAPRCTVSPPLPGDLAAVACIDHCRPSLWARISRRTEAEPRKAQSDTTPPHAATQACDHDHRRGRYRFYRVAGRRAGSPVAHHGESSLEAKGRNRKTHAPRRRRSAPPLLRGPSRAPRPSKPCCRRRS